MKNNKIIILFPGVGYDCHLPYLYFIGNKYEQLGFEKKELNYGHLFASGTSIADKVKELKEFILNEVKNIDFSKYDEIVFCEKSIGTVAGFFVESMLGIHVTHICLTPIEETLPYMTKDSRIKIVVGGTKDKYLDHHLLEKHCIKNNFPYYKIDGVGHRLEDLDNVMRSIDILKEVLKRC